MPCSAAITLGILSFAMTSNALATLASAKESPKEIVYLDRLGVSMFIRLLFVYFASKATLTPMAMIPPSPSISTANKAIIPETQRTNWRALRFAARLWAAVMGR